MDSAPKRLNFFERYLSLWVLLCMIVGVALGKLQPGSATALSKLEFGEGSQGQRMISSSGGRRSRIARSPGVWAMSPMFTVCQEDLIKTLFIIKAFLKLCSSAGNAQLAQGFQ